MEELQLRLEELVNQKNETEQLIANIDRAIASCNAGIRKIIGQFYASGFWARPKRSKCIKRR